MAAQTSPSAPLLGNSTDGRDQQPKSTSPQDEEDDADLPSSRRLHGWCRRFLASRRKHFLVMGVVALDVAALLANVFIKLIACEMHQADEPWVLNITKGLETLGLIFSCLFMVELGACLFAFGFSYLKSWFHIFDSAVIIISFLIDVSSQGLAESIGSLVVVLRLWRLAKISEEVVMGATERMEILEQQLDDLEKENKELRTRFGIEHPDHSAPE